MKYYSVVTSLRGKKSETVIKAINRDTAMDIAKAKKLGAVIKAIEIPAPLAIRVEEKIRAVISTIRGKEKIKLNDMIPAFRQMSLMLNAGLSIHQCLNDLIEFTANPLLRQIFSDVLSGINSGKTLTQSFMPYKDELGSLCIAMIDLGEQTGGLADSLMMLTNALDEIRENVAKFKKAIRYPIIVMTAMTGAFVFLINMIVPKFKGIFEKFGAELPLPTKILLGIENIISNYGLLTLAIIASIIVLTMNMYKKSPEFRFAYDKKFLKLYLFGRLGFLSAINQFLGTLSILLKAGLPLEGALRSSASMTTNVYLKEKLEFIPDAIKKGVNLTDAFKETKLFESSAIQMVNAGEQSGNLDEMLGIAGNYYKMKYNQIIDNLQAYIEPILTAVIAALVTLLALGIFMPMWDLMGAAKGK